MPKKLRAAVLVSLLALTGAACGDGEDQSGSPSTSSSSGSGSGSGTHAGEHETTAKTIPASEAEVTVDVVLNDFKIEGIPETVDGHKILFKAKNDGPTEHELVIMKGSKEIAEIEGLDRGESGEMALELEPGRYSAVCLIGSGGARHDKLGMAVNFTVS